MIIATWIRGWSGKSPIPIANTNGEFLAVVVHVSSAHSLYAKWNHLLRSWAMINDKMKKMSIGMKMRDSGPILSSTTLVCPANIIKSTATRTISCIGESILSIISSADFRIFTTDSPQRVIIASMNGRIMNINNVSRNTPGCMETISPAKIKR